MQFTFKIDLDPTKEPAPEPAYSAPRIGEMMPDKTIYVGVSPDTGMPMYTTPADAPLGMKWKMAMKYAADLHANGHHDWRVATKNELNMLFNNRAAIGGFNVSGSGPLGCYWSATPYFVWSAWGQCFRAGYQGGFDEGNRSSVRLVRSEASKA